MHIYIINNSTGEEHIRTATADIYRGDLAAAGYGNGYHGFSYSINWLDYKPATYSVYAYAIGIGSPNVLLNNSPIDFTVRNMAGSVDVLTSTGIGGWAWKPDAPDESVGVHVHILDNADTILRIITKSANEYRSDLASEGYGNGYHGFTIPINWDEFGEAKFRVIVYMYDGSGVSPVLYDSSYDNRKPIYLLGMTDSQGIRHSSWMFQNAVPTYCENIGCSRLERLTAASGLTSRYPYNVYIKNSSYCAISTHGNKYGIQWSMRGVYGGHENCENPNCGICYGLFTTDDIRSLPNNYFSGTRCFVTTACKTASGGANDTTNFVNALHSKGVETVVGFKSETWFRYYLDTLETVTDMGSPKWLTEFTRLLGEGNTVEYAANRAYEITLDANIRASDYSWDEFNNGEIPQKVLTEEIYCGLDSLCIVGDKNQIVKH